MRSAFIFLLGVSAVILFIICLNLIVVPFVLGPASSTLSCDVSKLVRGMSRDQLKIVCGNPQRINRRYVNDLEEQWVFPNGTHVSHFLVSALFHTRRSKMRPKVSAPAQPSGSLGHRNADPARQYPWSALLQRQDEGIYRDRAEALSHIPG
jgi:hypothetical protein